jgi:ribose transport system permease protein
MAALRVEIKAVVQIPDAHHAGGRRCRSRLFGLNMGAEFLLASIAVVVIGGTSVAGGFANIPGLWGAALFMFLLVTMLNTFGLGAGIRLIMTGLIIISVITLAGGKSAGR